MKYEVCQTSTLYEYWESNPRPSDLKSNPFSITTTDYMIKITGAAYDAVEH